MLSVIKHAGKEAGKPAGKEARAIFKEVGAMPFRGLLKLSSVYKGIFSQLSENLVRGKVQDHAKCLND